MITPVLAAVAYILSPDGRNVLLLHRNKRPDDLHYGKYLGLGGKIERDEDIVTGIRREIAEESGLFVEDIVIRGTVLWPGFGKGGQDWFGFVVRVDRYRGDALSEIDEGTLEWVPLDDLKSVPMWESDHEWLPMVFDNDPRQFHGVMPYHEGNMVAWSYQRI